MNKYEIDASKLDAINSTNHNANKSESNVGENRHISLNERILITQRLWNLSFLDKTSIIQLLSDKPHGVIKFVFIHTQRL